MVTNEEIGAASLVIAKAIDERAEHLRASDFDPQRLVSEITDVCDLLYACIDPDLIDKDKPCPPLGPT
jgi:hypothetical protein